MKSMIKPKAAATTACLLVLLVFVFYACKRQDGIIKSQPINVAEVKAWLHKKGLAYKNETITVQAEGEKVLTGRLNWQKAGQYNWQGRDYIDVPFEFNGQTEITDAGTAKARFNIVIRKNAGGYEGALRTETHGVSLNDDDNKNKTVQIYEFLNGEKANVWYSNLDYSAPRSAQAENITEAVYLQRKRLAADEKKS